MRPAPNLEGQGVSLHWLLPFDLSGLGVPAGSYATAGIALGVTEAFKIPHHVKVETPSGESYHDTHVLNITIYYMNLRRLSTNKTSSAVQTKLLSMYIFKKFTGLTNATTHINFSFFYVLGNYLMDTFIPLY